MEFQLLAGLSFRYILIKLAVGYANELILKNLSEKKVAELYSTLKIIENNLSSFKSHSMS